MKGQRFRVRHEHDGYYWVIDTRFADLDRRYVRHERTRRAAQEFADRLNEETTNTNTDLTGADAATMEATVARDWGRFVR